MLLSDAGDPICEPCSNGVEVDRADQRAAGSIFAASGSALALGTLAVFFNPCLLFSLLGVLSALGTFGLLHRHPEYRARLGWRFFATVAVAALGLVVALIAPVARVVVDVVLDLVGVG